MRNSLYALSENGLTLVELALFLTDSRFRAACMKRVQNADIRQYFEGRYDQASEAMRDLYGLPESGGAGSGGGFYSLAEGISPFVSLMTTSGTAGQTVEILGNGFTGTTSVMFGSGSASFTISERYVHDCRCPCFGYDWDCHRDDALRHP